MGGSLFSGSTSAEPATAPAPTVTATPRNSMLPRPSKRRQPTVCPFIYPVGHLVLPLLLAVAVSRVSRCHIRGSPQQPRACPTPCPQGPSESWLEPGTR